MNVKNKTNCKTESNFFIMFNKTNIQHGGPHSDSWRAAGLNTAGLIYAFAGVNSK